MWKTADDGGGTVSSDHFRLADHPGVDRFDQRYRVFHALCELGGAQSIRDSNQ
jgi:hypothetical protein